MLNGLNTHRIPLIMEWLIVLMFLVLLSGCSSPGKGLFTQHGCINCHSFENRGGGIGPDLTEVRSRRTEGWIRAQIENPKLHNPYTQMPSFNHLDEYERDALIRYIMKK